MSTQKSSLTTDSLSTAFRQRIARCQDTTVVDYLDKIGSVGRDDGVGLRGRKREDDRDHFIELNFYKRITNPFKIDSNHAVS